MSLPPRTAGKLGALPLTRDRRTLRLASYLPPMAALGPPPLSRDWLSLVGTGNWEMLGNDLYGDCVEAAAGHMEQLWTRALGVEQVVRTSEVLAAYNAITGWTAADPSSDRGTDPLAALKYWRRHGICGHKIGAFVEVNVTRNEELKWAIERFGALYAAIDFPDTGMAQFNAGKAWSVVPGAQSEGGHMVMLGAYDDYHIGAVTWGQVQPMTWGFWHKYRTAAFAVLSPQWTGPNGRSPAGVYLADLKRDLAALPGA